MGQQKFRHPSEMPPRDKRVPVSVRVKLATKKALEEKVGKLSLAELISNVLDDYVDWLKDPKNK